MADFPQEPVHDIQADERKRKFESCWAARIRPILPGLSLGNVQASFNKEMLTNNHITAIVSLSDARWTRWVVDTRQAGIPHDHHKFIKCHDSSTQDLLVHMSDICDFIDRMAPPALVDSQSLPSHEAAAVSDNIPSVLVHCDMGLSRSPTVIIAYLMRKYRIPREEVQRYVRTKQKVKPNANFIRQLEIWQGVQYEVWEDKEKGIAKGPYQAFLDDRAILLQQIVHKPF